MYLFHSFQLLFPRWLYDLSIKFRCFRHLWSISTSPITYMPFLYEPIHVHVCVYAPWLFSCNILEEMAPLFIPAHLSLPFFTLMQILWLFQNLLDPEKRILLYVQPLLQSKPEEVRRVELSTKAIEVKLQVLQCCQELKFGRQSIGVVRKGEAQNW